MTNDYRTILYEPSSGGYSSKDLSSINPTLSFLHEIMLLYLKELSFYLLKLKEFGVTNNGIKEAIIHSLALIIIDAEYKQEEFHKILLNLNFYIEQSKNLYKNICEKNNIKIETTKVYFKDNERDDLIKTIKKGEKHFLKKNTSLTLLQKNLFDIMIFLIKSVGIKLVELDRLGKDDFETYYSTLSILNTMDFYKISIKKIKQEITNYVKVYYKIAKLVFDTQIELYGEPKPTKASFSNYEGKAIMVSGSDFKKLELILKATKNKGIDVYTHGLDMLMAHAFPKLHSYANLKGHFGMDVDSCLVDFAAFPGAILMTRGTLEKVEYLYRGRLFTMDPLAPSGIIKIEDNDFEPLIKSSLEAKGFVKNQQKHSQNIWFNEKEIKQKVETIINDMKNGKIKQLYIVGLLNRPHGYNQYFNKFFELLPKNCFVISLSCKKNSENIFHIDSLYDFSLIYRHIIKEIERIDPSEKRKITIFITKCDKHMLANSIYLKSIGIKNIYICKSPAITTFGSPTLINSLEETFGIKRMSTPEKDLADTLLNK